MFDIYAAITDRIIAELEKGQIPWQKLWVSTVAVKATGSYGFSNTKPSALLPRVSFLPLGCHGQRLIA